MTPALHIDERHAIDLVAIPPGAFTMGSTHGLPLELPVHPVRIPRPFHLGRFPVTQTQWLAVMGHNPSAFTGVGELPVDGVNWEEARTFCARLSAATGCRVRLPAEAEWEYACRAGSTSEFFFGDSEQALGDFAWFDLNSGGRPHPVGLKRPNAWGLHDLIGNVWEWCEDVWDSDYEGAPADGSAWLAAAAEQPRRAPVPAIPAE